MLSPADKLFTWSKRDRTPPVSLFRMLARQWEPPVRRPVAEEADAEAEKKAVVTPKGKTLRPVWTPWLWVER